MGFSQAPTLRRVAAAAVALSAPLLAACEPTQGAASHRATLVATGPASIKILPSAGQPPYCLVFTVSEKGVVRQLTMSPANESIPCAAGQPIGDTEYRIPPIEGKVRIHVILSDRKLDATPVAQQVRELGKSPGFSAMDLRAPGRVVLETLELAPQP
jgi:hypothetical protein